MPALPRSRRLVLVGALVTFLASLPAAGQGPAPAPDAGLLERQASAAEAASDWAAALEAAVALNEQREEAHVEALLRVARLHARLGHTEQALECLERLPHVGLLDVGQVRREEAFAPLRDHPRFKAAAQAIWLKGYLWLLERPERDAYQQPDRVMETLALRPGERVADIGAGSGYFTRRAARAVGPTGTVWALDIRREILDYLDATMAREGLTNVRSAVVLPDDPQLPAGQVDTILMVDTLHYVKDRAAYAKKLRAGLADGGRVVIIDFRPKPIEQRSWGPPPSQEMSREEVDAAMAEAGLAPARVHDYLTEQFFVEYRVRQDSR
jgi:ubiquinone/menaquinone biosynthesis C-methylase UbiE